MPALAVVVAVSEYLGSISDLPACRQDGHAVADIVENTNRFDEVLFLSGSNETISSNVKARLSALADAYRGKPISELLFYYTGHGNFDGSEFRYVLSDYNAKKPSQTTLSNSELDGIFRSLNPDLFVKIVDACNSGISYVKNDSELDEYLKGSKGAFSNVYFMFSSQQSEVSYASKELSYFTRSLLSSISEADDGPYRYRDLMSAASDEFATSGAGQTPQFIVQATNTEIFCDVDKDLRDIVRRYIKSPPIDLTKPPSKSALVDRIKIDAAKFCSEDEAKAVLQSVAERFRKHKVSPPLKGIFSIEVEEKPGAASSATDIGKWLQDNLDRNVFARANVREEPYIQRVPKNSNPFKPFSIASLDIDDDEYYKSVTKTRKVAVGYNITTDQGLGHIILRFVPALEGVNPAECVVALLVSRTHIVFFWRMTRFKFKDWSSTVPIVSTQWNRSESLLKDTAVVAQIVGDICRDAEGRIHDELLERWPEPETAVDDDETLPAGD